MTDSARNWDVGRIVVEPFDVFMAYNDDDGVRHVVYLIPGEAKQVALDLLEEAVRAEVQWLAQRRFERQLEQPMQRPGPRPCPRPQGDNPVA